MPLLRIADLTVRFGGIVALDGVALDVEQGEIAAIIGPNGAGKTTVFNCITRIFRPERGSIRLDGRELLRMPAHQVVRAGVARTFQNLELFPSMHVLGNVLMGRHSTMRSNLLECALGMPRAGSEERSAREAVDELLRRLDLYAYRYTPVGSLPFGFKKRVELARALAAKPRLLLLDEPANGLSHDEVSNLAGLVRSLREELPVTILLIEHHMGFVMGLADRVHVLDNGRKIAEGTPAEVQRNAEVIEAYLGETVA